MRRFYERRGFLTLREIGDLIVAGAGEFGALRLSRRQCVEFLERQKRDIEAALGKRRQTYSSLYLCQIECGEFDPR